MKFYLSDVFLLGSDIESQNDEEDGGSESGTFAVCLFLHKPIRHSEALQ